MSASARPVGRGEEIVERPPVRLAPSEGWSTLVVLVGMLAVVALAVDDADWAGTGVRNVRQTSFLVWVMPVAGLLGFVLAKSRMRALPAHLLSAIAATALMMVAIAGVISDSTSLQVRLRELHVSTAIFYNDVVVEGIRSAETSVFLLTLGAVAWATGHFAAFSVFRRHQAVMPVLITGSLLLLNMSITIRQQYLHLVLFSAFALVLLMRLNLLEQRQGWHRRRIGDIGPVSRQFVRSGSLLVIGALIGSVVLSTIGSSAPLAGVWRNAEGQLAELGATLNRVAGGVTGPARGQGTLFGESQAIRGVWQHSTEPVFTVQSSDGLGYYWRGATYDAFDGILWQQLDRGTGVRVEPGQELLSSTTEAADIDARHEVTLRVTPISLGLGVLLAPDAPSTADRATDVYTSDPGGAVASMEFPDWVQAGDSYTVSALVRSEGREEAGVTRNQLAVAGTDYPAWVERYRDIRPNSIGELTYRTADQIVAGLAPNERNPLRIAEAIQDHLYSKGGFIYQTDVRHLCSGRRVVDCFLQVKRGYCEYFASAMVMLLRTQGIPARYAAGYLPGKRQADGTWQVDRGAAHSWAEVYFPSYGWIRFDPTPGNTENGQNPTDLETGGAAAPPPSAAPEPSPTFRRAGDGGPDDDPERRRPAATGGTNRSDQGSIGALLLAGLLPAVVLIALWARRRRGGSGVTTPDIAYRSVARLATRFGHGPRPAQTAYEYAGTLSEVVPAVRSELQLVAQAKVESTYAGRHPAPDMVVALRDAYHRIRRRLLRLAARRVRPRRPHVPRRNHG